VDVRLEIMIPLTMTPKELEICRALADNTARAVRAEFGCEVPFAFGTMIELPRAVLLAGELATLSDFLSFGTNDLTQTTLGLSRDDAGKFLGTYVEAQIFAKDPFRTIDRPGVGMLVKMAAERARAVRPNIKLGVCGEHGGDPESIQFFHEIGLDYVSCSPYRVPVARLSAAQAALTPAGPIAPLGET
jgi:pyruvate,orthophosphate dikinase